MTYQNDDNQGGGFQRQMFDVSDMGLKCAECGTDITELPFKPTDSERPVYCRECNRNRKSQFSGRRPFNNNRGRRF